MPDPHPQAILNQSPRLLEPDCTPPNSGTQPAETLTHTGDAATQGTAQHDAVSVEERRTRDARSAPRETHGSFTLYRFYDRSGTLLYVGRTVRIEDRLSTHRREKSWWTDAARIDLQHFHSADALAEAEADQIKRLRPIYNIALTVPTPADLADRPEREQRMPGAFLYPAELCDALGWTRSDLESALQAGCPRWRIGPSRAIAHLRFKWAEVKTWIDEQGDSLSRGGLA